MGSSAQPAVVRHHRGPQQRVPELPWASSRGLAPRRPPTTSRAGGGLRHHQTGHLVLDRQELVALWGKGGWGEEGYIWMQRDVGKQGGLCGITTYTILSTAAAAAAY